MKLIVNKKPIIPVSNELLIHLQKSGRQMPLPLEYDDLLRFSDSFPVYDRDDNPTLWESVIYPNHLDDDLHNSLTQIYVILLAGGDQSIMEHLSVDRIDYCAFANSRPFRIRVKNRFNDNHDHFYIKQADASRIYGLEMEGLISPNRINYLMDRNTLIEEHIIGIPGDTYIEEGLNHKNLNHVRLGKEFVKFNERCFACLIGDMRSYNYVINVTPDVEEEQYRVRPIDFDQFCHEGKLKVYLPQFFSENQKIVQLCMDYLNPKTVRQYQHEERNLIGRRYLYAKSQINSLIRCMKTGDIAPEENVIHLRNDLTEFHKNKRFLKCKTMGDILQENITSIITPKN